MIIVYILVAILAILVLGIATIELSGPVGNNIIQQKQKAKKLKIKHLLEKQEELQNIIAKLEKVNETQADYIRKLELVNNWITPDPIQQEQAMNNVLLAFEKEQNAQKEQ